MDGSEQSHAENQTEGWKIVEESYKTVSGSSAIGQRPGFVKLLDRLEPGDVLVVTKLDRLGRNAIDVGLTVAKLEAMGVRVHCLGPLVVLT
jgi:DNA invertase Pin-like site-specific DNA recombinase